MSFKFSLIFILLFIQILIWFFYFYIKKKNNRFLPKASKKIESNFQIKLNKNKIKWRNIFICFGLIFLGIASSGPQIGTKVKQVERRGIDLVIALDTSASMDAEDVAPSRLKKAKLTQ